MARDPHTLFAYWDIDWSAAFEERPPLARQVYLRLLNLDGSEQDATEVEPMQGSCYLTVSEADAGYTGEIGFYGPAGAWKALATSASISTPPDLVAENSGATFATVPFHLTFQGMIDALRISKQEPESLTAMLAHLRERISSAGEGIRITSDELALARVLEEADSADASVARANAAARPWWTEQRLERIFGFGTSSPTGGFGGSS